MSQLTEDNLPIGFFDEFESYYFIGKFDDRKEAEQLKQQILDDYEKARKWDTLISSYPEWKDWSLLPTQLNQLVKDAKYGHELRKRLEESKK